MIDLQCYRARIGLFGNRCPGSNNRKIMKNSNSDMNNNNHLFKVSFLALFAISVISCTLDSSIETNPGPPSPHFKPFHHSSQEEKQTFLQIRLLNTDLDKIRRHIEFLSNCQKESLIPNGLRTKVSLATARSNDRVKRKLWNIPENGLKESLNLILQHHKEEIPILTKLKKLLLKRLKLLCDEVRFIRMTDALASFTEKEQRYLDEGKKEKFNNLKLGSREHPVSAINTRKGHSEINHAQLQYLLSV